jgi:hypothetical protein
MLLASLTPALGVLSRPRRRERQVHAHQLRELVANHHHLSRHAEILVTAFVFTGAIGYPGACSRGFVRPGSTSWPRSGENEKARLRRNRSGTHTEISKGLFSGTFHFVIITM